MLATEQIVIRHVTGNDLGTTVDLLYDFGFATAYRVIPSDTTRYDPRQYIAGWVIRQLEQKPTAIFVAEEDGRLVGICAGSIVDFPMVPDFPHLWEWAWHVHPGHEDLKMKLWKRLVKWAKANGARGANYGEPALLNGKLQETLHWRIWS